MHPGQIAILAATTFCLTLPAHAEVKKLLNVCGGQACPSYEIVLKAPDGWFEDQVASKENRLQIVLPKGKNFGNAEALIYVKISLKDKDQKIEEFIGNSQERWKQQVPDTKISKRPDIARANGKPAFISYAYENPSQPQQAFETLSFGIDTDTDGNEFIVMVVMTERAKKGLERAQKTYEALLRTH